MAVDDLFDATNWIIGHWVCLASIHPRYCCRVPAPVQ
jgi:hypothetical protein